MNSTYHEVGQMQNRIEVLRLLSLVCCIIVLPSMLLGQVPDQVGWADTVAAQYRVFPDITYLVANNYEAKLDVYVPRNVPGPLPTLMYIHGGGWVGGTKEGAVLSVLPYLQLGWVVVNVEYRLGRISLAPAAVEDCLCALRWMYRNTREYKIDTTMIVVTGHSAGGHLALTTGMIPASAGLDRQCAGGPEEPKVAAIINWYGITDVGDLLDGANRKTYAVNWIASLTNREEIAKRVSPMTYVRKGLPPTLSIHGDADPTVPYIHAVRLHEALEKFGVPNQLVTIPGGKHGGFSPAQSMRAYSAIREFLAKCNILK